MCLHPHNLDKLCHWVTPCHISGRFAHRSMHTRVRAKKCCCGIVCNTCNAHQRNKEIQLVLTEPTSMSDILLVAFCLTEFFFRGGFAAASSAPDASLAFFTDFFFAALRINLHGRTPRFSRWCSTSFSRDLNVVFLPSALGSLKTCVPSPYGTPGSRIGACGVCVCGGGGGV